MQKTSFLSVIFIMSNLFGMQDNFFIEFEFSRGIPTIVHIKNKLESYTSEYQTIEIYETVHFGTMMVIDGSVMLTQADNFAYHEMIVHVPMNAHPNPKRVLIVGGGDGGTVKEVLRYASVQEVVLCEIDEAVIALSKKYFPEFAPVFDDPRLTIVMQDAAEYIKTEQNSFDVICVDSIDPVGPGQVLFATQFYADMARALTADGIAVTQSESMFYSPDLIETLQQQNKDLFACVDYYYTLVPTYPSGTIGFSFCSKRYTPFEAVNDERIMSLGDVRYYNKAIHYASFCLPQFLKARLQGQ